MKTYKTRNLLSLTIGVGIIGAIGNAAKAIPFSMLGLGDLGLLRRRRRHTTAARAGIVLSNAN